MPRSDQIDDTMTAASVALCGTAIGPSFGGADFSPTSADSMWSANMPLDQPFGLILNLAIGGGLPEESGLGGALEEGFPNRMEAGWVRVSECNFDPAAERDCASKQGE